MHFFIRKKAHCYFKPHSFANVLYLSICMQGNCSCFNFRLLTFFKIKFLQINLPGHHRSVKQFESSSRPTIYWSSSGFKLFAKGYWQTIKFSAGMQRVITGKYTMHNKFSNFLGFASFLCSSLCNADQFNCDDENRISGK